MAILQSAQIEGEQVAAVLQASLDMDAKLADVGKATFNRMDIPTESMNYMDRLDQLLMRLAIQVIHGTCLARSLLR